MAPMAQRSSGSSRRGSGGDGGRRGKRKPSGLHRVWPVTEVADGSDVVALPVGLAQP